MIILPFGCCSDLGDFYMLFISLNLLKYKNNSVKY